MPISIIDNFDVNAAKNIDARLGPYDTTASAKAAIDETTQRYLGLTIVVTGSGNLEEYWFQDGVTDSDLVLKPSSAGTGTLQQVMDAGSTASVSTDIEIENGGGRLFFDGIDESISITSSGSAGTGAIFLNSWNGTGTPISASLGVVAGHIYFQGSNLGIPSAGNVLVATNAQGRVKWTGSSAVGGGGTDPKYLVYETGSGTDSIKPSHGNGNVSSGLRSTVAGGANNGACNSNTFVGGGEENCALQSKAAVLGGEKNKACQGYTVAGGGYFNTANDSFAGVWSGCKNTAEGDSSAILGGRNNEASGDCSTIGGGQLNCARQTHDFIGGGCCNKTSNTGVSSFNSILGGELNEILDEFGNSTSHSTIGGGECNKIDADHAVIGGGCKNFIGGAFLNPEASTIGGGHNNFISSSASTIAGGEGNHINEQSECSFIGGGHQNIISLLANTNTIGGGTQNNIAEGACCGGILGGQRNKLQHDHSFIIGSNLTSSAACTTFMNNAVFKGSTITSGSVTIHSIVTTNPNIDFENDGTNSPLSRIVGQSYASGTSGGLNFLYHNGTSLTEGFRLRSTGAVGIGTTTPPQKLTVEGNISASGFISSSGNIVSNDTMLSSTGSFGYVILDYDNMPTSDPNVKGAVYRSGNDLLISAG